MVRRLGALLRRMRRDAAGFTLLETLVAVTVFATVAVGGVTYLARFSSAAGLTSSDHVTTRAGSPTTLGAVSEEAAAVDTIEGALRAANEASVNPSTPSITGWGGVPDTTLSGVSEWTVTWNQSAGTLLISPVGGHGPSPITIATHVRMFAAQCMAPDGTEFLGPQHFRWGDWGQGYWNGLQYNCYNAQSDFWDGSFGVEFGLSIGNTPSNLMDWAWARP